MKRCTTHLQAMKRHKILSKQIPFHHYNKIMMDIVERTIRVVLYFRWSAAEYRDWNSCFLSVRNKRERKTARSDPSHQCYSNKEQSDYPKRRTSVSFLFNRVGNQRAAVWGDAGGSTIRWRRCWFALKVRVWIGKGRAGLGSIRNGEDTTSLFFMCMAGCNSIKPLFQLRKKLGNCFNGVCYTVRYDYYPKITNSAWKWEIARIFFNYYSFWKACGYDRAWSEAGRRRSRTAFLIFNKSVPQPGLHPSTICLP